MICLYPKFLPRPNALSYYVACGKCIVCREQRIKDWYIRLVAELSFCEFSRTITLTYEEDNLPVGSELDIEDVKKFFKRMRKRKLKIKYYCAGEYGEKRGRPHYHCIVYCYNELPIKEFDQYVKDCWTKGNPYIDNTSGKSIRYTLDYLQKDYWRWKGKRKVEPFQTMSKHLGLNYLLKNIDQISKRGYIVHLGVKYRVPRYYRKVSEYVDESLKESIKRKYDAGEITDSDSHKMYRESIDHRLYGDQGRAQQIEKNIKQRKKLKRGSL